jgi:ABC-type transport system involved in cytochrome bd biosynthesis fused ATPase/permease subunit
MLPFMSAESSSGLGIGRAVAAATALDLVIACSPPIALFLSTTSLGWVVPIGIGIACAAVRPIASQRLRTGVRRALFERTVERTLSAHRALPEQAAQDVAITVALAERAALTDLPRTIGAAAAGLVASAMGCVLLGAIPAVVLVVCALLFWLGRRPLVARLSRAVDATFERRLAVTTRIAAAARNDGEIRTAAQRDAFMRNGLAEADRVTRAESRELALVIAHRALWAVLTLVAVAIVVVGLQDRSLIALAQSIGGASIGSLRGVLLFVAAASQLGVAAGGAVELRRVRDEIAQRGTFLSPPIRHGTTAVAAPGKLVARGLTVVLGERTALGPITFDLELRGLIAIAGPNGAGKTTLMRAIAGTLPATSGTIEIDSVSCRDLAPETIAVIPQSPIVLESSTVRANLELIAPDTAHATETLRSLGLDVSLDRLAGELSRGEARRVAIARGLLSDAPILLLDESDAWLDAGTRGALMSMLREQAKTRTVIIVSHREDILRACDCVLLLTREHGLAGIGAVHELLEKSPAMTAVLNADDAP